MNLETANRLITRGWATLNLDIDASFPSAVLKISQTLGIPIKHRSSQSILHELTPTRSALGPPNSLTAKYSTGPFPLHVDTAHWLTPCRYVVLACLSVRVGSRSTELLDFMTLNLSEAERKALHSRPYLIRNGRNSFYGTILSDDRKFIRYDPGCMALIGDASPLIDEVFSKARVDPLIEKVIWQPGLVVIIDNWRVLHGRGGEESSEQDRTLLRVLII